MLWAVVVKKASVGKNVRNTQLKERLFCGKKQNFWGKDPSCTHFLLLHLSLRTEEKRQKFNEKNTKNDGKNTGNELFGGKFFQKASFQKFSFSAPKREISKFYVNFEYF